MEKKNETEQLDMGLKEPVSNKLRGFKYRVEFFFVKLRTNSLFTAPFLWISFALASSFTLIQYYYYANFIDKLPKQVPLFLIAKNPDSRLVDKDLLLWYLVLSAFIAIISLLISIKIYYKFKFMAIFITTNLILGLLLLTISYIKIFSLYIF